MESSRCGSIKERKQGVSEPLVKEERLGFPGGLVVKNPTYNSGDTGLIHGHVGKIPQAKGQTRLAHNY